ncbi:MAG TPA: hypothetical protein DCF68_02800 [Cyanothece sp. UBA12306]|nr:hypothetical protein [Cyanothece sp. UBA12306]
MDILHTKGKIIEGQLILDDFQNNLPTNTEVEVIIFIKGATKKKEFEAARQEMQKTFKDAGIKSREQILELIQDVKKELFEERSR